MRSNKPVLSLIRPSETYVDALVQQRSVGGFTYDEVGSTEGALPVGWSHDEKSVTLGQGEITWNAAQTALKGWRQFDLKWIWPSSKDTPLEAGACFAFVSRALGVWSVNICRVVYIIQEETENAHRFGFAYGTVGPHAVCGEEQFVLEWNRTSDQVTFGIRKFSRPANALLAALGPMTRWVQHRFTEDALARMQKEVVQ
jgi:uncharacterized protein (UPF0548 family)